MNRNRGNLRLAAGTGLLLAVCAMAGSPNAFRTLVVVNTNSVDSVELGEYYAAAHGIPAHHVCRLGIATNLVSINSNEFSSLLLDPIHSHITAEGLEALIDYVVLCWEFPTRIRFVEGVSAALFYGYQNAPGYFDPPRSCKLPEYTSNAYYRAERAFRSADGWNGTNGFVAFHLIASNLATAKMVVDRGVAAQSSFPPADIHLHMIYGGSRGIREQLFSDAQFSFTSLPGLPLNFVLAPLYQNLSGQTHVIGYQDGYGGIPAVVRSSNVWLPGAYADHMTSSGGMIQDFQNSTNQSTILDWMGIGATASYGTVAEPCNYLAKFPDPVMGFYYARGFTIGEAYAMSVAAPYQGLFAGDPLAAPFAAPPVISVPFPAPFQIVTGTVPVQVTAIAHAQGVPAASLDYYLDGRFQTNLVTLEPAPGNRLSVTVGDWTHSATVTLTDTLFDAVAALADAVNADSSLAVRATACSDRLELVYTNYDRDGDHLPVSASVSQESATALTLGVGLAANSLIPSIYPAREYVELATYTTNGANAGDAITSIITLTNGVAVTNIIIAAQGETAAQLLDRLKDAINAHPALTNANGVVYDRLASSPSTSGAVFARSPGPEGRLIHLGYWISAVDTNGLVTDYSFSDYLNDNARESDILPRASILFHVRPTNGILETTVSVDTAGLSDGVHVLDFIARDGSAVAAQSRFSLPLVVGNESPQLAVLGTNGEGVVNNDLPDLTKGTDFGPVEWGASRTNTLAIGNDGPASLSIAGWSTTGPGTDTFEVVGIPALIEAGGVSNFTVVFAPAVTGRFQVALGFDSDAVFPQTNILFAGTGVPRSQNIDFPALPDQIATNEILLSATATSDLDVEFSVADGPAVLNGPLLSFTNTGIVSIVASQDGNDLWEPAPSLTNSFMVMKALATVTLFDLWQTYNGAARPVSFTTAPADLKVDITYNGMDSPPTNAGSYAVTGTVQEVLYEGSAADLLAVAPAPLTVTADSQTKPYGAPNPPLTFHYSGFVAGDDATVLIAEPVAGTTVDVTTPAGTYPGAITVSGGLADNYEFHYVAADFTVTEVVPVRISALATDRQEMHVIFGPVEEGFSYDLFFCTSLTNGPWLSVTAMVATAPAESASLAHAISNPVRGFYRIATLAGQTNPPGLLFSGDPPLHLAPGLAAPGLVRNPDCTK